MDMSILEGLFARHYDDAPTALNRFRQHLAEIVPNFDVESNITEAPFCEPSGLPKALPPIISYNIPKTRFGSLQKPSLSHNNTADGLGLNTGCPIRLAHAMEVFFSLKAEDRHEPLAHLKSNENHLACDEELLWLTVWKSQSNIRRGGELVNAAEGQQAKNVDWYFESDHLSIFLEAKFRQSDWLRLADREFGRVGDGFFDDIGSKLPSEKLSFHKYVAGITGFAEPDPTFFIQCEKRLISTPAICALLYRSLLGPIAVCSLSQTTVSTIAKRLKFPGPGEYPGFYGIGFDRALQAERLKAFASPQRHGKGIMYCQILPGPIPPFRPKYPQRFKITKRSSRGFPTFENVPAFISQPSVPA